MKTWLLIRRLRGPAFLLLVGITALLNQWDILSFSRSWPLYLILFGVMSLAERAALSQAQMDAFDPITGQLRTPDSTIYGSWFRDRRSFPRRLLQRRDRIPAQGGRNGCLASALSSTITRPREQQKAYWRAQKDAFRTQRDYWKAQRRDQRYYWRSMHRPSIVGPIVLLSFGVIALLITSGKLSGPLLLGLVHPLVAGPAGRHWIGFAAGVVSRSRPTIPPQIGGFGIVLLIFILLGIAYSERHAGDWSRQMGIGQF